MAESRVTVQIGNDGDLAFTPDGWAHLRRGDGPYVWLRFQWDGAAFHLAELRATAISGAPISSEMLRGIPMERVSAAVNIRKNREAIAAFIAGCVIVHNGRADAPDLRISQPPGHRKPDEFYAAVADLHLRQILVSKSPAKDLADANGVPVTTIHRWLKESRRRQTSGLADPRHPNRQGSGRAAP